jgi:hypothetical protein
MSDSGGGSSHTFHSRMLKWFATCIEFDVIAFDWGGMAIAGISSSSCSRRFVPWSILGFCLGVRHRFWAIGRRYYKISEVMFHLYAHFSELITLIGRVKTIPKYPIPYLTPGLISRSLHIQDHAHEHALGDYGSKFILTSDPKTVIAPRHSQFCQI